MPGTPLHFRLRFFLTAAGVKRTAFVTPQPWIWVKHASGVRSEMKVRIEDRSAPWQIRLSIHLRNGCGRRDYTLEKCSSLHDSHP